MVKSTITNDITLMINNHLKNILTDISKRFSIDEKSLIERYIGEEYSNSIFNTNDIKKKRGRKKKQKDEFIETEEYEYKGEKYLVDGFNNVYSYNIEKPVMIGERLVDGTIKLYE
jgi:hypothetical protein